MTKLSYRSDEEQPVGIVRSKVEFYRVLLFPKFFKVEIELRVTVRLVAKFQSARFQRVIRHLLTSFRLRGHSSGQRCRGCVTRRVFPHTRSRTTD